MPGASVVEKEPLGPEITTCVSGNGPIASSTQSLAEAVPPLSLITDLTRVRVAVLGPPPVTARITLSCLVRGPLEPKIMMM